MLTVIHWTTLGLVFGIVFASFFEWLLHRFLMHRPVRRFRYPYERHTLIHHRIFKADYTYHLIHEHDRHTIPMAWWNGPALIALCEVPFIVSAIYSGNWGWPAARCWPLSFTMRATNIFTGACTCRVSVMLNVPESSFG
jgi:hypothetical protein